MPADKTIDTVLMIIAGGLLTMGLLSVLIGWLTRMWDRIVNRSQPAPVYATVPEWQADQTDGTDRPSVSTDEYACAKLQLDRSKQALIEVMVYNGWTTGEVRSLIKGDNGAIGVEVDAARQRLGLDPPERTLRVKDERGERVIPI